MEQVEKWNEDFIKPLMEAQKKDAKKERKEQRIFIFNQGRIENPAKSR